MLVPLGFQPNDPILSFVSMMGGNSPVAVEERIGVYRIGHFGSSHWPNTRTWNHYPEFSDGRGDGGVCDNLGQVLREYPELESSDRRFAVTLTEVRRADQPSLDGWRWHKWGKYIGDHAAACEYLYDEDEIDAVLIFRIYEMIPAPEARVK